MITKLVVNYKISLLRFDEESFFITNLGFSPYWDYKSYDEYYFREKIKNLGTINIIYWKCDVIDSYILNGVRQPLLYSFVLDRPPAYRKFSGPETILYRKIIKSVWNFIAFHFEDGNHKKNNFNRDTLTFTLQMIEILTNK